jgi:hypothetical protein
MNKLLIMGLVAIATSTAAFAAAPSKDTTTYLGANFDLGAFQVPCFNIFSSNFATSQSTTAGNSAQINLFGEDTCGIGIFFSSGVQQTGITFNQGPAGNSFTSYGTIRVYTIGWGYELISYDVTVTATGERQQRNWGTNNVLDGNTRYVYTYDNIGKPATANLNLSGNLAGKPFNYSVSNVPTTIGSQKSSTTIVGLPAQ